MPADLDPSACCRGGGGGGGGGGWLTMVPTDPDPSACCPGGEPDGGRSGCVMASPPDPYPCVMASASCRGCGLPMYGNQRGESGYGGGGGCMSLSWPFMSPTKSCRKASASEDCTVSRLPMAQTLGPAERVGGRRRSQVTFRWCLYDFW